MAINHNKMPFLAFLAGLLIPGMGQFLAGRKKRGLLFFLPANLLFLSALTIIAAKLFRATQAIPADSAQRWPQIRDFLLADGLGPLPILGILYIALLLAGALDARRLFRQLSEKLRRNGE